MKYKVAIFDMDGTILDTLDDLTDTMNFCLEKYGLPIRTRDEVQSFVGNGIHLLVERAVPKGMDAETIERIFQDFLEHYRVHCNDRTKPYDGILKLLSDLRNMGCRTAVVSNKADEAVHILCDQYFEGLFDAAAGEKQGVRKKPAPDSVNAVLDKLGLSREDAVYIGDSDVDIQTAENAGMPCISVSWGFRDIPFLKRCGASQIVEKPQEILQLLA